jgi:hypothetical protein
MRGGRREGARYGEMGTSSSFAMPLLSASVPTAAMAEEEELRTEEGEARDEQGVAARSSGHGELRPSASHGREQDREPRELREKEAGRDEEAPRWGLRRKTQARACIGTWSRGAWAPAERSEQRENVGREKKLCSEGEKLDNGRTLRG